jgi:hypothetical protein
VKSYDVIVCGGGTAGMVAGIAAGRMGARVLLVEREGYLGGSAAYGIPFLGFFSGDGTRVVGGIPEEIVIRMVSEGGCAGHARGGYWNRDIVKSDYEFSLTPFDPECLKYVVQEMALHSGADLLLQATLCGVTTHERSVTSIEVMTVEGLKRLEAKVFIDATGDAILTRLAGFDCEMRGRGRMQNVTHMMRVGNVDREQMQQNLRDGESILGRDTWHTRIIEGDLLDNKPGLVHMAGILDIWPDKHPHTFTAVGWRREEMSFNLTRTVDIDPTSAEDITKAEISERRNIHESVKALREKVPGFEKAYLISSSTRVGIREGCRIQGEFTIDEKSVLSGEEFSDGVARGAYPIDVHDPQGGNTQFSFIKSGGSYAIPYPCIVPKNSGNLLAAGRCISATGKALGSVRLMATCMAVGQASGTAAVMAAKTGCFSIEVKSADLRKNLQKAGAILEVSG